MLDFPGYNIDEFEIESQNNGILEHVYLRLQIMA